jgi:hypothetical protein
MNQRRFRSRLILLLVVSYGLRVWLAARGGQNFWADEHRYEASQHVIADVGQGRWHDAGRELFGNAIHPLFAWFGLLPAMLEEVIGPHPAMVAGYFALFSVLAIYLIWAVARRAGAGEPEALWAAYLAACANSLFYYSRHFFPYDISLCAMLGALWLGLGPWSWRNSLLAGATAAIGFLTYNGYWWLGGCVLILHALLGAGGRRRIVARAAWSAAGLLAVVAALAGLAAIQGYDLVGSSREFAGTITQGDFYSGYRQIPAYLWFAEGGSAVVWSAAFAFALWRAGHERRFGRLAWAAGGVVLFGGGLIFFSDIVPKFVVYGRLARGLVPFLCLGAAAGIVQYVESRPAKRAWTVALALLVGGLAAMNLSRPLRQVFPEKFRRLAAATAAREPDYRAYRLTFIEDLWGLPLDGALPPGPAILRRSHPLQFRPYQFEGYGAAQRAAINRHDIAMQLIPWPGRLDPVDPRWRGYPGPARFVVRFPTNATGLSEPLVTTGHTGRGDIFYVHYLDATHLSFGLDHWGIGATVSAPIAVDYSQPHEIILLAGFLLPPADPAQESQRPELARQRGHLLISLDGRPAFSMAESFFPVPRDTIAFGVNFIGGSVARSSFTGNILEFGRPSATALASASSALAAHPPPEPVRAP